MATSREMEEYGVVPIHFRFFFPGLETALAMLSGVLEMIARILVSLLAVPAFGCLAVCFGDPTAWIFADAFLIPAFIYVYRRILRMKKN